MTNLEKFLKIKSILQEKGETTPQYELTYREVNYRSFDAGYSQVLTSSATPGSVERGPHDDIIFYNCTEEVLDTMLESLDNREHLVPVSELQKQSGNKSNEELREEIQELSKNLLQKLQEKADSLEDEQAAEKEQPTWDDVRKAIKLAYHKGYNIGQKDAELHPLALTIANHIHEDTEEIIKHLKQDRG